MDGEAEHNRKAGISGKEEGKNLEKKVSLEGYT